LSPSCNKKTKKNKTNTSSKKTPTTVFSGIISCLIRSVKTGRYIFR
jgi:hypothetical protein